MGIKNLIKLINKYSPDSIKNTKITKYKNKTIGIDTNLMIYKMVYAIRKNGYDLKNKNIITTHIHTMLLKLLKFKYYNIKPIFVFDGKQPKMKEQTLKQREEQAIKLYKSDPKKYYMYKTKITDKEINEIKNLIILFGYPVIQSSGEADIELGKLVNGGSIKYVASDDMDILLTSPKVKLLKNFTVNPTKTMQEIDCNELLHTLKITQKELIDIGIMLGCDYCQSSKNIGPVKAYSIITKKKQWSKPTRYNEIQKYFLVGKKTIKYKEFGVNKAKLVSYLLKFGYLEEKIDNYLSKL